LVLKGIKQGIKLAYEGTHYNPVYRFHFQDAKNEAINQWYEVNASLSPRATLRGIIESIALGAGEDITKFIENPYSDSNFLKACIGLEFGVKVVTKVSEKTGKSYNNVKGMSALRSVNYPSVTDFENCEAPFEFKDFTKPYTPKETTGEALPDYTGEVGFVASNKDDEDDVNF